MSLARQGKAEAILSKRPRPRKGATSSRAAAGAELRIEQHRAVEKREFRSLRDRIGDMAREIPAGAGMEPAKALATKSLGGAEFRHMRVAVEHAIGIDPAAALRAFGAVVLAQDGKDDLAAGRQRLGHFRQKTGGEVDAAMGQHGLRDDEIELRAKDVAGEISVIREARPLDRDGVVSKFARDGVIDQPGIGVDAEITVR